MSDVPVKAAEAGSVRLVLTLAVAGLLSGAGIVGAYELTLPIITANKERALKEAVFKVVPGATAMQKLVPGAGGLTVAAAGDKTPGVFAAYDGAGALKGYAIAGDGPGFQDTISLLYGFDPAQRKIVGMEVLVSRETPGLGDKIYKDLGFVSQFGLLAVEPSIVGVKKGTKSAPNEIDVITGATISSKALVKIINNTNTAWLAKLPAPGKEPPAPSAGAAPAPAAAAAPTAAPGAPAAPAPDAAAVPLPPTTPGAAEVTP